jgi:hypothetical protein
MARINCSVRSCRFWSQDQICQADSIMVKNNKPGDVDDELLSPDLELGVIGNVDANSSGETCCETFRPRKG